DVHRRGGAPGEARAAAEAGLALAQEADGEDRFSLLTLALQDGLALAHTEARELSQGQRFAQAMKRESQRRGLLVWELKANERLLRVEDIRHAWALARAYPDENPSQPFYS